MSIDISQLLPPEIIEVISYDDILADMKETLSDNNPDLKAALEIESEPVTQQLQIAAYRELLLRQEFNDRAKGLMLSYAVGSNLDHIGLTYYGTGRNTLVEEDLSAIPPVDAVYESDENYRARLLLATDSYSTAGPEAAYRFHALSAGAVKDISIVSPTFTRLTLTPEQEAALPVGAQAYTPDDDLGLADPTPASVVITVLGYDGNGIPTAELITAVTDKLNSDVRPITDEVFVQAPTIHTYTVNATLTVYEGFNQTNILKSAKENLAAWIESQHMLGRDITVVGVKSALLVEGVHDVTLNSVLGTDLTSNLIVGNTEAAYCDISDPESGSYGITVSISGIGG